MTGPADGTDPAEPGVDPARNGGYTGGARPSGSRAALFCPLRVPEPTMKRTR